MYKYYYCVSPNNFFFLFSLQENGAKGMDGLRSGCILPLRASYTTDGHDSYTTSSVADINDGGGGVVTDEREEE
jgi:hypothetical protein